MTEIRHDNAAGPLGVVVIGRNEGDRLIRCLGSVAAAGIGAAQVVYVDSGSDDGSIDAAHRLGVSVVALDGTAPFTAARARNAGFKRLLELIPTLGYVFFVDGDCEIDRAWPAVATRFLAARSDVAVVWGRRRERYPERSWYNLLCDIEWAIAPIGEAQACGGDALMRAAAFAAATGYRDELICGEEPELCVRLRRLGWRIWRLDAPMTLHDAAIYRFGQWWRRMVRSGYAFAQGAALHGLEPERLWVRESRRIWAWGLAVPIIIVSMVVFFGAEWLALLGIYVVQFVRLALAHGSVARARWLWAGAMIIGKFPEMLGQARFELDRITRRHSALIEYK